MQYVINVTFGQGDTGSGYANFAPGATQSTDFNVTTNTLGPGFFPATSYSSSTPGDYAAIDGSTLIFRKGNPTQPQWPVPYVYYQWNIPIVPYQCNVSGGEVRVSANSAPPINTISRGYAGPEPRGCVSVTEAAAPVSVPAVPWLGVVVLAALLVVFAKREKRND